MYLWNRDKLLEDLKQDATHKGFRLYTFMGPALGLVIVTMWTLLLVSHLFLAHVFKHFIAGSDVYVKLYTTLGILAALGTILINIATLYECYAVNKKGDGKNFCRRMACINTFINTHMILYTFAIAGALVIAGFIIVAGKAVVFSQEVQDLLESHNLGQVIHEALENSPLKGIIGKSFYQEGLLGSLLALPSKLIDLPIVFQKLETFIEVSRTILLGLYPAIACIPLVMSYAHYTISYHCFKLMQSNQ